MFTFFDNHLLSGNWTCFCSLPVIIDNPPPLQIQLKEIRELYKGHTLVNHSAILPLGNILTPCHLPSTFFLHSIYKPQIEKRWWSIRKLKEKGLTNILFNIKAIGMCVIEGRQFISLSLVFSTSESDFTCATDQCVVSHVHESII